MPTIIVATTNPNPQNHSNQYIEVNTAGSSDPIAYAMGALAARAGRVVRVGSHESKNPEYMRGFNQMIARMCEDNAELGHA